MSPTGQTQPSALAITGSLSIDTDAGRLTFHADGSRITLSAERLRTAVHAARVLRKAGIDRLIDSAPAQVRNDLACPVSVVVRGNAIAAGRSDRPSDFKLRPAAALKAALRIHGDDGHPLGP